MINNRKVLKSEEYLATGEFAAELLMPKSEFVLKCKELSRGGSIKIQDIADYFHVSIRAATVRGAILGLWS